MSATRVQRSASSRYGVVSRIVRPSRCSRASSRQKSRRETGSTPVVGSSSTSSSGVWTSVQTSASFCFMPPGQPLGEAVAEGRHAHHLEQRVAARGVVAHVVDLGEEGDVLVDAEVAVEREALREVADLRREPPPLAQRVEAAGAHAPGVGLQQAEDRAQRRRLARAVGADQAEHLAAPHVEGHARRRPRTSPKRRETPLDATSASRACAGAARWPTRGARVAHGSPRRRGCSRAVDGMPGLNRPSPFSSATLIR